MVFKKRLQFVTFFKKKREKFAVFVETLQEIKDSAIKRKRTRLSNKV